jgi:hypothetical protein
MGHGKSLYSISRATRVTSMPGDIMDADADGIGVLSRAELVCAAARAALGHPRRQRSGLQLPKINRVASRRVAGQRIGSSRDYGGGGNQTVRLRMIREPLARLQIRDSAVEFAQMSAVPAHAAAPAGWYPT